MSYNGYTGYLGWAGQKCPTLKPGETYNSRSTKFSQMTNELTSNIQIDNDSYKSITNFTYSKVKAKDYKPPDRRGIMAKNDKHIEKLISRPFLGKSLHHEQYRDLKGITKNHISSISLDKYKNAYNQIFLKTKSNNNLHLKSKFIEFLTLVHDKEPTEYELNIYQKYFENNSNDTIPSWDNFKECIIKSNEYFQINGSNFSGKHVQPTWMTSNVPKKVIQSITKESSHHIDYGKYGTTPLKRSYIRKTGMATTTRDLDVGTTRDSYHVPGYGGFIPTAPNNPVAITQGNGQNKRNRGEDLRLYYRNNLPGYTGHQPDSCINYCGTMRTGLNKLTTNGSTFKSFQ